MNWKWGMWNLAVASLRAADPWAVVMNAPGFVDFLVDSIKLAWDCYVKSQHQALQQQFSAQCLKGTPSINIYTIYHGRITAERPHQVMYLYHKIHHSTWNVIIHDHYSGSKLWVGSGGFSVTIRFGIGGWIHHHHNLSLHPDWQEWQFWKLLFLSALKI